jgi:hypothetical protein
VVVQTLYVNTGPFNIKEHHGFGYLKSPELVHSLYFSSFYLSPLLMVVSTDYKFYIHSCIEGTSTIFTFLTSFYYICVCVCVCV